jgi:hypothetical protein
MKILYNPKTWAEVVLHPPQVGFATCSMCVLLFTEWLLETRLNTTMNGAHFVTSDGRMAEAVVRIAYQFAAFPNLTDLNPIQGFGSQLLPPNVWINPINWPLGLLDGKLATDIAGLVALTCIAVACYVMARCFDLSTLPSVIAAQLSLVMFGPVGPLLTFTASFVLLPGMAAVYAPYIVALGLLARIDSGRIKDFLLYTGAITALIFYSVCCDPLWSIVSGISWAVPFAVVALSASRIKTVMMRCAALGACLVLLFASGALLYVYTITQYTARVYFSALLERPFAPTYTSMLLSSPYAKYFYGLCMLGWTAGLIVTVGRARVLVVTGSASFLFFLLYALAFILLDVSWWLPLPFYIEHSLAPLFMVSAFAGCWSATQSVVTRIRLSSPGIVSARRLAVRAWIPFLAGLVAVLVVPVGGMLFATERAKIVLARYYTTPWPNEPELAEYLLRSTGLSVGQTYRGSSLFLSDDTASLANLWKRGVPTLNEYSQLITPQAFYLQIALMGSSPGLNRFGSGAVIHDGNAHTVFKTIQAMGVRYIISDNVLMEADKQKLLNGTAPYRPHDALPGAEPRLWHIYQLPNPNLGNYSPTEITVADSAPEIVAILSAKDFDFRHRVALSSGDLDLVPAHNMRLKVNRGGGFHVSGQSDGISLIILPQQFSHCLMASDQNVRIVRADLAWTGLIFSREIDTDISFGYGVFSPGCRRADIADMKRLGIGLPANASNRTAGWQGANERFQAALNAFTSFWCRPSAVVGQNELIA